MLNKITMPSAGQTTDTLKIAQWHKSVGDPVKRGDILIEVETDKANLEVESFAKGTLLKILFQEGDSVKVGEVIAYVGDAGDLEKESVAPVAQDDADNEYTPILPQSSQPVVSVSAAKYQASPAAKKAARDRGISLEELAASSGKTLLKLADVLGSAGQSAGDEGYELVPLTSMRKTIANRMFTSTSTIPSYTVEVEVDMSALISLRSDYKGRGEKVAYHDLLAKCVAVAIEKHPYVNGSYTEDGLRLHKQVNVGIAVAMDAGLIVPVVRNVAGKRIAEIARESAALVDKARAGKLSQTEMQGGTITISNLGSFPVNRFTAIINPPESCILAVGGTINRPCIVEGELQERPFAVITATFDHRIIDGAYGAAFMTDLKRYIENPLAML